MRLPIRSLATLVLAVGVATCADAPTVARARGARSSGRIALNPVFSQEAAAVYAQRAQFAGLDFDHVRIVLVRPPGEVVKDTTVVFASGSSPKTIDLSVDVTSIGEVFDGTLDYTSNGLVVYSGQGRFTSYAPGEPAPDQPNIVVVYVGPGATATKVTVSPKTAALVAPATQTFTATVVDANNAPVAGVPIAWSSSDPSVVTVNATTGAAATTGKRGTATITASAPSQAGVLTDNATVTVTLPPAAIALVSGGGQTGTVGATLPEPGRVRVTAADGLGTAGVAVTFAAPTGGSVGSASVATDANGEAATSLTLGSTVGPQSFAAVAGGLTVRIPATATAAPASAIVALSGSGQQDTVTKTLKAPFVAKVTDQFGNGVAGVTVNWARTAGTGTLAGATSTTGADGTASMAYTLGATPGVETVTASVTGIQAPATFTATAVTGAAAAITIVSGQGQSGEVAQPLGAPFVVKVTDASGQPVSGASVQWAATNGTFTTPTTTTDAKGQTSATLTAGSVAGSASATATVGSGAGAKSVTFSAFIQPGPVAQLVFTVPPTLVAVGQPLTPAIQLQFQDALGNRTSTTDTVTISLGANPGDGSLGGTLRQQAVAGVATFPDLTISLSGVGYTLVASSPRLSVTSAPFSVIIVGTPSQFSLTPTTAVTTVGTPLPAASYPKAVVTDASNNPVPNVPVFFFVEGGACTTPAELIVNTDATGTARLTSANLNVPTASPGSCLVEAGVSTLEASGFTGIVVAPTTGFTWLGTVDSQWSNGANWRGGVAPSAPSDAVFIPSWVVTATNTPQLTTSTTVGDLTIEGSGPGFLDLEDNSLTVTGNLAAGGSGVGSPNTFGDVQLTSAGAATISGLISVPTTIGSPNGCGGATFTVSGSLAIVNPVFSPVVVNCPLNLAGQAVVVSGSLTVNGTAPSAGALTFGGGALSVTGAMTVNGTTTPMSSGALVAMGDINDLETTATAFAGSGFTVTMAGTAPQNIVVSSAGSGANFRNLAIATGAQVTMNSAAVNVNGSIDVLNGGYLIVPSAAAPSVLTFLSGGAIALHAGSRLTLNGSITPITTATCSSHNGTPAPTIDGTNSAEIPLFTQATSCNLINLP